jgi:hypothetical protein
MLTFDDHFASDGGFGCVLWATDEPANKRVRFNIGSEILQDVLHGKSPVHHEVNVNLCNRERHRIEEACRRAFANRPSESINLEPSDFS